MGQLNASELVTLGVWRNLAGLGDRKVLGEPLEFVEPQDKKIVHDVKLAIPEMEKEHS